MRLTKTFKILILSCLFTLFAVSQAFAEYKSTYTWVPSSGYAFAINGSAYPNTVYLYSDFEWSSESRLSGLKSDYNETLEMDIVFYNYDGNAYAYNWYNYSDTNRYQGTYWDTNQPWPYWDTLASDGNDERSFCVGCSDANLFQANTLYYWWGYAVKHSNGSMAKIVAQRGYRSPDYRLSDTWSVFSEQSQIIVPFSSWTTPGSKSWTY